MTESLRLLLVEDDQIDQLAFRRMVEREELPYHCTIAATSTEACGLLQRQNFDLILADYSLSDGTAFDVMDCASDTPVIFVTGMGNEHIAVAAMKAGAYDYLTKDSEGSYLDLLPLIVDNVIKRRTSELEAREMARERIRRETLEQFFRLASHDLRTPLTTLSTSLYLLDKYAHKLMDMTTTAEVDIAALQKMIERVIERVGEMDQQRGHLEHIILDMLEMIRIDNLSLLEMSACDLNELIAPVLPPYEPRLQAKRLTLRYAPALKPLMLLANADEFGEIVSQLLDNAIEFTPPGGKITICTNSSDDAVMFKVSDTGIGIAPEVMKHIFQRFYRADSARTLDSEGTGLGLAIVQRLVELHHGRVEVESVEGHGTSFRVVLPGLKV